MSRVHKYLLVPALVVGSALTALAYAVDPARVEWLPPCPFHQLTGLWCPGCGGTRAFHQLVHGNFLAALHLNPVAISLLPLAGYFVVRGEWTTVRPIWIWSLLSVVIAFGILRNIPIYPLTLLAP